MRLTQDERDMIADGTAERVDGALLRSVAQWSEILGPLSATDAAARIVGDLICFQPDRGIKRRHGALGDVMQLARALDAWARVCALDPTEGEDVP